MLRVEKEHCIFFDIEVYPNFNCVAIIDGGTGDRKLYTCRGDGDLTHTELCSMLLNRTFVGYRSIGYDLPLLVSMLRGKDTMSIYKASKMIIDNKLSYYELFNASKPIKLLGKSVNLWDLSRTHIDVERFNKGVAVSLKLLGCRMNVDYVESLPYNPHNELADDEIKHLVKYCHNDVVMTEMLYDRYQDELALRMELEANKDERDGKNYVLMRESKLGEVLICNTLGKREPTKENFTFYYSPTEKVKFKTEGLNRLKDQLSNTPIHVSVDTGLSKIRLGGVAKIPIVVGGNTYTVALGGIHRVDPPSETKGIIIDSDVSSYYPNLIYNEHIVPKQYTDVSTFRKIYKGIIDDKVKFQREGNKSKEKMVKLIINIIYGKFGDINSTVYDRECGVKTTITGQLYLLMLIEALTEAGFDVINANTDGIMVKLESLNQMAKYLDICNAWCADLGLELKHKEYEYFCFNNISDYFAVPLGGGVPVKKGCYSYTSLVKHPEHQIVYDAVMHYLIDGMHPKAFFEMYSGFIKEFIQEFIIVKQAKDAGILNATTGEKLGGVCRFVWVKDGDDLQSLKSGGKVPLGNSVEVIQRLGEIKGELDLDRYVDAALEIIANIKGGGEKKHKKTKQKRKAMTAFAKKVSKAEERLDAQLERDMKRLEDKRMKGITALNSDHEKALTRLIQSHEKERSKLGEMKEDAIKLDEKYGD